VWLLRSAIALLGGEKILKWVATIVVGLLALAFVEAAGSTAAIMAQPFGQWWLAGVSGAVKSSPPAALPETAADIGQLSLAVAPQPQPTFVPQPRVAVQPVEQVATGRVVAVIAEAMTYMGTPYLWGGCSHRGIDCSCFVMNALAVVGIHAPRVTTAQIGWTTRIPTSEIGAGDLVYFDNTCTDCGGNPTHVGLALDNQTMVQAGGAQVSIQSFRSGFYGQHFASAGRVPGL
jgi:cell wall-associated NlpC family hydrolase